MGTSLQVFLIAAIGGIAVAVQAQMMGLMDRGMGTLESVFITYGSGGLLAGLLMMLARGGNLGSWQGLPWFVFLAGAAGLVIVGSISYSVPRMGLVGAFTVMLAAQFIAAALLDHYALMGAELRQLSPSRLLGIGVMLLGVWLTLRR